MSIARKYALAIVAPTLLAVGIFYFLNFNSRRSLEKKTSELAISEGKTIEQLMRMAGFHLLEKGESDLVRYLAELSANEQIIYLALSRERKLIYAETRFEGYLPIEPDSPPVGAFDSPLGKILGVSAVIDSKTAGRYTVYIGYHFTALNEISETARKNFLLMTVIQTLILVTIVLVLIRLNRMIVRREIELQKEKEEKEKMQEISLITAGITHEIKNPLNSLYLSFQMLEPMIRTDDEDARFYVQALRKEVKRINDIIGRFSRLGHELPVHWGKIALPEFLDEMKPLFRELGRDIKLVLRAEAGLEIESDRDLLKQVLINLVNNAVDAGAGGIEITARDVKDHFELKVQDDGHGIPPDQLKYIFDPFVSYKAKGNGIGLAIVKKIIRSLGGGIEVSSRQNEGTSFIITLPNRKKSE